jgi:hypothetical protein
MPMSDPLTNLEIQDVLSSIRRLVSEDKRARSDLLEDKKLSSSPLSIKGNEGGTGENSGKLVLTPALRIPDAEEDADRDIVADWASDADSDARDDQAGDESTAASLEDTIAELEAAVAGADDQFEPDGSEIVRGENGAAVVLGKAFDDGFEVDVGDEPKLGNIDQTITTDAVEIQEETEEDSVPDENHSQRTEPADGDWTAELAGRDRNEGTAREANEADSDEFAFDDADETALLDEEPAEDPREEYSSDDDKLDEPISGKLDTVADTELAESDVGGNEHDSIAMNDASSDEKNNDAGAGFMFGRTDPARHRVIRPTIIRPSGDESDTGAAKGMSRLTLTAADAAGGADAGDPWERDDARPVAGSAEDMDVTASVEADDTPPDEAKIVEIDAGSLDANDELDAEILRDIVGEVIRAELQGPLGERITRNVRMLVRREINRALEARGLGGTSDRD